jgi:hypothetical protein
MKCRRRGLVRLALLTNLGGQSLAAGPAKADPNALRANAQAELAAVTVDVTRPISCLQRLIPLAERTSRMSSRISGNTSQGG